MRDEALVAGLEEGDGGMIRLLAPHVGLWSDRPADGALLSPGASAGTLTVIGRPHALVVPTGVVGRVLPHPSHDRSIPVGFGDAVLVLAPIEAGAQAQVAATAPSQSGALALRAPSAGVFYGSSAPGSPPFVAVGARVGTGQTIGLLEVMKTFNPIAYGGPGLPDEAEVVEVLVTDGQEVVRGQPLVRLR